MSQIDSAAPDDKLRNQDDIDWIISAGIPNKNDHPRLYEIVQSCMIHGPCGHLRPESVCMEDNVCTKGYPKEFCDSGEGVARPSHTIISNRIACSWT